MKRHNIVHTQGFTLIEIAGALLIFALMAMPLISMQFSMLKSVSRSYTTVCAILTLRAYPVELERDGKFTFEKASKKGQREAALRFESTTEHPPFKRTLELVKFKPQSVGKVFASARVLCLGAKPDSVDPNVGSTFQMTTFIAVPPPKESNQKEGQQIKPLQKGKTSPGKMPSGSGKKT